MRLTYHPPFGWEDLLSFLAARAIPGVEHVGDGFYRRTARLGGDHAVIDVTHDAAACCLVVAIRPAGSAPLMPLVTRLRRMFDLDADPRSIAPDLSRDALLARCVERRPGLRLPVAWDPFELVVRAILGQQVTVRGATTVAGRIAARYGETCAIADAPLNRLFPTPAVLAAAELREVGLTRARAATVRDVAVAVRDGRIRMDDADRDGTLRALAGIRGIGDWTVQYVAMRGFGEPDAFPAGDLGLRKALGRDGAPASIGELEQRAAAWRPWRAYAALHLWQG